MSSAEERTARQAEALRANLARRKSQRQARREPPLSGACRRNADVLLETIPLAGLAVVDVGCGDGALSRRMGRAGARVVGIECAPCQLARASAADPVEGVSIVAGVGQSLPLADGWADLVVFFNSLHHIPVCHQAAALAEAARVLRPGGRVYAAEPLPEGAFFEAVRPIDDETWMRGAAFASLAGAWAHGLISAGGFTYTHPLVIADYDAFRDRIVSANAEREARFAALDVEMRARFAGLGRPVAGGYAFEQPMRVDLLRKDG